MSPDDELRGRLAGLLGAPVALEELKHKPGRRRTLRAAGARRSAIVKLYASERAATVAARSLALSAGPAEPVVPRLLRCEPDRRLVVLSYVPGPPLREALLAGDGQACGRAGFALGSWHAFWRGRRPGSMRRHTCARELEILAERAALLPAAPADDVMRLAGAAEPEWPCPTVVHRDLYEEQLMVGQRIGLIDLDDAALGPPELDVGNLWAHVELLALRSGRALDGIAERLLRGYARSGAPLDPALVERCRRLSLLRLFCIHDEPRLLALAGGAQAKAGITRSATRRSWSRILGTPSTA